MSEKTPREQALQRWGTLKTERSSWVPHWQELSNHLLPRSGRFFTQDRNRGEKRHNNIYDSTGTRAVRILGAGMMSGATSPARPWFRLGTSDPDLNQFAPVKLWLSDVTRLMLMVFAKSNTYRALHSQYEELGVFGTGPSIILPNYKTVIHQHPLTAGEYAIGTDYNGNVDTIYREFEVTVDQMVGEFGYNACSITVRNLYDRGSVDAWVPIMHVIEPRKARDYAKRDAANMAWKSCYLETGSNKEKDFLRESGFKRFPGVAPRWQVAGGDIYGNSPGMEALGDVKQLQHEQLRKAQGIDYKTKPPMQAPTSAKGREHDLLPGGVSYIDTATQGGGLRTAFEVNLDLSHLLEDIRDVRERINGAFYADLFLMLANDTRSGITATEVAERHEEKLLMLGPVLERLHNELLDPLIEITFERMLESGIVPPPPPELQGQDLSVEFVSMLAQAQRAVATNGIDRFVGNLGAIAQFKPDVLDKFNADEWADAYSDMLGVDPTLIVPDNQVALIRNQRAQAQQEAAMSEQMAQRAAATRDLAAADTSGRNALTDAAAMFSGYTTPQSGLQ